jgi:hypothetical protein
MLQARLGGPPGEGCRAETLAKLQGLGSVRRYAPGRDAAAASIEASGPGPWPAGGCGAQFPGGDGSAWRSLAHGWSQARDAALMRLPWRQAGGARDIRRLSRTEAGLADRLPGFALAAARDASRPFLRAGAPSPASRHPAWRPGRRAPPSGARDTLSAGVAIPRVRFRHVCLTATARQGSLLEPQSDAIREPSPPRPGRRGPPRPGTPP